MLAPIEGTPYLGGNRPGFVSVAADGKQHLIKRTEDVLDPTVLDDSSGGHASGSLWRNTVSGKVWYCRSANLGAADWVDLTASTSPGGSANSLQFNNGSGNFGGDGNLTWNGSTLAVTGAASINAMSGNPFTVRVNGANALVIDSSKNATFSGTVAVAGATTFSNTISFAKPADAEIDVFKINRYNGPYMFKWTVSAYDEQYLDLRNANNANLIRFVRGGTVEVPGSLVVSGNFGAHYLGIARAFDGLVLSRFTETDGMGSYFELQTNKEAEGTWQPIFKWDRNRTYCDVTAPFGLPAGSAATPSLTFTGDTNTGIYSPAADQIALATGGTVRCTISSTQAAFSKMVRCETGNYEAGLYVNAGWLGTSKPVAAITSYSSSGVLELYNAYSATPRVIIHADSGPVFNGGVDCTNVTGTTFGLRTYGNSYASNDYACSSQLKNGTPQGVVGLRTWINSDYYQGYFLSYGHQVAESHLQAETVLASNYGVSLIPNLNVATGGASAVRIYAGGINASNLRLSVSPSATRFHYNGSTSLYADLAMSQYGECTFTSPVGGGTHAFTFNSTHPYSQGVRVVCDNSLNDDTYSGLCVQNATHYLLCVSKPGKIAFGPVPVRSSPFVDDLTLHTYNTSDCETKGLTMYNHGTYNNNFSGVTFRSEGFGAHYARISAYGVSHVAAPDDRTTVLRRSGRRTDEVAAN